MMGTVRGCHGVAQSVMPRWNNGQCQAAAKLCGSKRRTGHAGLNWQMSEFARVFAMDIVWDASARLRFETRFSVSYLNDR
jgi:hypothetical protein